MNPLVKGRRYIFAALFLILFASVVLAGCMGPENPDLSHIEGTECPDEKILEHIEKDFADYLAVTSKYDPKKDGLIPIEYCYGTYNDCVPVMFSLPSTGALREVEVAGSIICYRSGASIYVWNDGKFFLIEEAYERGLLTKEHVAKIAYIHNNIRYS